jgi:hypothetical protein
LRLDGTEAVVLLERQYLTSFVFFRASYQIANCRILHDRDCGLHPRSTRSKRCAKRFYSKSKMGRDSRGHWENYTQTLVFQTKKFAPQCRNKPNSKRFAPQFFEPSSRPQTYHI